MAERRVLVIEDDPRLRAEIVHSLGEWNIVEAEDGEQAIENLWNGGFDAVVLDLMLPRLSGYDVIRHLSMHRPELLRKTIVVTGVTDPSVRFFNEHDVHAIISKPLAPGVLIASLEVMVG